MTVKLLIELIGVCLIGLRATESKLEMNRAVSDRDGDAWILGVCRRVVHASWGNQSSGDDRNSHDHRGVLGDRDALGVEATYHVVDDAARGGLATEVEGPYPVGGAFEGGRS